MRLPSWGMRLRKLVGQTSPWGGSPEKREELRKWALSVQEICTHEANEHQQATDEVAASQLAAQREENQQLAAQLQ